MGEGAKNVVQKPNLNGNTQKPQYQLGHFAVFFEAKRPFQRLFGSPVTELFSFRSTAQKNDA